MRTSVMSRIGKSFRAICKQPGSLTEAPTPLGCAGGGGLGGAEVAGQVFEGIRNGLSEVDGEIEGCKP